MADLIPDVIMDLTVSGTGAILSVNALATPVTVNAVETPISLYSTETIGPVGPGGPSAVSNTPGNVATLGNDYLILVPGPVTGDAGVNQVVKGSDSRLSVATLSTPGLLRKLDGVSSHVLQGDGNWGTPVGAGDMLKRDYDPNSDGVVEHAVLADTVPFSGITGATSGFTPAAHAATHLPGSTDPIAVASRTSSGLVPTPSNDPNTFLSGLATFIRALPAGVILPFGGGTAPVGFLLADGTSYLRTDFPDLFTAIGTTYGAVDGTHFNVPDLRGRTVVGAGSGPGLTARTLGGKTGEETHPLTSAELAAHTHGLSGHTHLGVDHLHSLQGHTHLGVNHLHNMDHYHNWNAQGSHTHGDAGHLHTYVAPFGSGNNWAAGAGWGNIGGNNTATGYQAANTPAGNTVYASQTNGGWVNTGACDRDLTTSGPSVGTTGAADRGLTTGGPNIDSTTTVGSGTPHNVMQPSLFLSYICKT